MIYADNNATTRVADEALQAMLPYLGELYGNPSSVHEIGKRARRAVEEARAQVAELVGARPDEIVFTGCGTESDNAALRGVLDALPEKNHVITSRVEHAAILNFASYLETKGFSVTYLNVDAGGRLDLDDLKAAITPKTAVASLMWANNETGVRFPVEEAAAICRQRGVVFHTDGVQAAGKTPIDLSKTQIDLMSMSGHKLHAPKGIGALYVREGTPFMPYLIGGYQEQGRRGGTESVPLIVAFGKACALAREGLQERCRTTAELRDRLEAGLLEKIPGCAVNGERDHRVCNTASIRIRGLKGKGIVEALNRSGIAASAGSACTSTLSLPSHVLSAMNLREAMESTSIRFSLGRYNTRAEIDEIVQKLPGIIEELRSKENSRGVAQSG